VTGQGEELENGRGFPSHSLLSTCADVDPIGTSSKNPSLREKTVFGRSQYEQLETSGLWAHNFALYALLKDFILVE
jgi:hypothetical protein